MASTFTTRHKNPNWTGEETSVLVEACVSNSKLGTSFSGPANGAMDSKLFWESVTENVNAIGCCQRTVAELKRKWIDVKSLTKKKEQRRQNAARQTGGGPAPQQLNEWEEKVLAFLPQCLVSGVQYGQDTFKDAAAKRPELHKKNAQITATCLNEEGDAANVTEEESDEDSDLKQTAIEDEHSTSAANTPPSTPSTAKPATAPPSKAAQFTPAKQATAPPSKAAQFTPAKQAAAPPSKAAQFTTAKQAAAPPSKAAQFTPAKQATAPPSKAAKLTPAKPTTAPPSKAAKLTPSKSATQTQPSTPVKPAAGRKRKSEEPCTCGEEIIRIEQARLDELEKHTGILERIALSLEAIAGYKAEKAIQNAFFEP